jgi:AcrR family transcriptional regulator
VTPTTKTALLNAAHDEFAEYGIAGARVDRIAAAAGVNKERIYGYFGSKKKLFDAVIEEALTALVDVVGLLGDDPVEYVGQCYDFYRRRPDVLRLLMWEALQYREGDLHGTEATRERCLQKVELLARNMATEPSREIAQTMFTLMGLAIWPSVLPQVAHLVVGDKPEEGMREHVMNFARRALDHPPPS